MKSLREKLEFLKEAKVVPVPPGRQKQWGTGTLLSPRGVDAAVRQVRRGN